jgi:hypothetical protein
MLNPGCYCGSPVSPVLVPVARALIIAVDFAECPGCPILLDYQESTADGSTSGITAVAPAGITEGEFLLILVGSVVASGGEVSDWKLPAGDWIRVPEAQLIPIIADLRESILLHLLSAVPCRRTKPIKRWW